VASFSVVGSYALLWVINRFLPLRVPPEEESAGLDITEFGEYPYEPALGGEAGIPEAQSHPPTPRTPTA
jgi:ammonia channel protein AmtB